MTAKYRLPAAIVACAAVFGLATAHVVAQDGLRSASLPDRTPTQPLPAVPPVDLFRVPPDAYRQPPGPVRPGRPGWPGRPAVGYPIYGVGDIGSTTPVTIVVAPNDGGRDDVDESRSGFLRLSVTPLTTDVFIDGAFSGRAIDFDTRMGRPVRAGIRRIELRSPGSRTTSVEARVAPGETLSYSGTLESDAPPPLPVRAPKRTFYVIDGCYAGDSAPDLAKLPASCRSRQVKTSDR